MATTTLMSFADFEHLDAGADKIELLRGELIRVPPPKFGHSRYSDLLSRELSTVIENSSAFNGMLVCREMGYCLSSDPDSWLQPDVSITHPNQAPQNDEEYCIGAPFIVFEMISPSETASQLQEKIDEYLANGAEEVWALYHKRRDAWVYSKGTNIARHETTSVHSDLLPGIDIPFDKFLR
jgi:Uma2 family endonuclease